MAILTAYQEAFKKEVIEKARGVRHFLVNVEQTHKDEIALKSGQKLYLDPKFNEVANRIHYGTVICPPRKLEGVIQKGARIWFNHLVTIMPRPRSLPQIIEHGIYYVGWTDQIDNCIDNQVIAYEDENGKVQAFQWWVLVKPKDSTHKIQNSVLNLDFVNGKMVNNVGEVAFIGEKTKKYLGIDVGDTIVYRDQARYEVEIDGEIYYRVRPTSIYYAEETKTERAV